MGNCFKLPAKCAHASSSLFHATRDTKPHNNNTYTDQQAPLESLNKSIIIDSHVTGNLRSFSFNDLKNATKNFRQENLLGEGGFGCVFKGWIDGNTFAPTKPGTGIVVAIKRLKAESFQEGVQPITWATRMKIAVDVARGLSFLHCLDAKVIYRDLKASNILLDSDFNAKLSDFGLARDGPTGDNTHVSTRVLGTQGYAAPEYVATGHLNPKSDVYSFGVVLLELLSGRRAMDNESGGLSEETLVEWAIPFLKDNKRVLRIMDTRLGGQYSKKGAQAAAAVALQCLHSDPKNRPSMIDVFVALEQLPTSKNIPRTPPQVKPDHHGTRHTNHPRKTTSLPGTNSM
ncbi:hypothetical protein EZV62_002017 [Acer yangbiense]|uniref:Protein kinase domain-containing protein n=1 Tax=Acer yangbiense TaxID=1000413 RepID=A0A5C7IWG9_9ROSI|nr:hypothetical protein EZV62_002017 [Acer yangbiense]